MDKENLKASDSGNLSEREEGKHALSPTLLSRELLPFPSNSPCRLLIYVTGLTGEGIEPQTPGTCPHSKAISHQRKAIATDQMLWSV